MFFLIFLIWYKIETKWEKNEIHKNKRGKMKQNEKNEKGNMRQNETKWEKIRKATMRKDPHFREKWETNRKMRKKNENLVQIVSPGRSSTCFKQTIFGKNAWGSLEKSGNLNQKRCEPGSRSVGFSYDTAGRGKGGPPLQRTWTYFFVDYIMFFIIVEPPDFTPKLLVLDSL